MNPTLPYDSSQNSQEQNLSASDHEFLKPQFVGTSSTIKQSPKMLTDKGFISLDHEVIVLDDDEGCNTNIDSDRFIHGKLDAKNKGKGVYHHSDYQVKETLASHSFIPDVEITTNANKVESNFPSSSHNFVDLDNYDSAEDDTWILYDEIVDVDKYATLQARFDNMDIPTGVEASIPWFPLGQIGNEINMETSSSFLEPRVKQGSGNQLKFKEELSNIPNLPSDMEFMNHITGSIQPLSSIPPYELNHTNSLHGNGPAKHDQPKHHDSLKRRKKHHLNKSSNKQSNKMMLEGETSAASNSTKNQTSFLNMPHSTFPVPGFTNVMNYLGLGQSKPHMPEEHAKMKTKGPIFGPLFPDISFHSLVPPPTPGGEDMSWFQGAAQNLANFAADHSTTTTVSPMSWFQGAAQNLANLAADHSTITTVSPMDLDNFLGNFESFKQFDSVEDHSDHYYTKHGSSTNRAPMKWTKKIQDDWKILEKDLPETIFVRIYESRMDLMRAVIIGAQGTPYHDGLFFFDIFFPNGYPDEPPKCHYHSGGLRLNPNLYNCGKVCLSLLNTWTGHGNEKWVPGMSTILQVLVSIQGLILNSKPFFNEPGYAHKSGSVAGENKSQRYNEETFLLSIKTMMYSIRRPPKHYEDFVRGHFFKKAHAILGACKAYVDGAHVGSEVKGDAQDLNVGNKNSSKPFQKSLNSLLNLLIDALKTIGVSDCDKFVLTTVASRSTRKSATSVGIKIK